MKGEQGFTVVEGIVAIAILSVVALGTLSTLNTASKALGVRDERQTAQTLAESQMEYVKKLGYLVSYTPAPIPGEYAGYSVAISTDSIPSRDANIQKIRVIVSHQGKPVLVAGNATLEGYKVKQ